MSPRVVLLSFASLLTAGTAFAQAPGEYPPTSAPGYAQPPPPQQVVAPAAPAPSERRWSIGVAIGQQELTSDAYGAYRQTFDIGQLALRYRPWRKLELELSLGGGHEYLEDGGEGDYAVAFGTFAARYRFNPHDKWNWWLLAGVGQTTLAMRNASDEELEAAGRMHAQFGGGIERRWARFALQFELRGIVAGPRQADLELEGAGPGLSGGNFSLGASYYF
ncbi:MAG: hypothetical protein SFX73_28755 [Kofleriaceae bacterium]|nr:hypothetical protein [Kofleriaceae bacterium]